MRLRGAMRAVAVLVCMAVMVSAEDDDLTEEQRAVLQQPASRGRKDIMGSEQMRGAAKL